jgi:signal transduction histidine kinase
LAAGLGALPVLLLAGLAVRTSRLRSELAAERAIMRQQRHFAQSVSHEFRTPLGVIQSAADLLADYTDRLEPARRREILDEIRTNTQLMSGMVEQVLLLGRLEGGRVALRPCRFNLAAQCRTTAARVAKAGHADRPILVDVPDEAAEVELDPAAFGSVLENLLGNALKYSPPDSPVTLRATLSPPGVVVVVTDRGIGIPADELASVGVPFHRCRNAGDRPGTGLGLAIVRAFVELRGGTVALASTEGQGTTVTVTLPLP